MTQLPNSETDYIKRDDPPFGHPNVTLFDEIQWSYMQNYYNLSRRERQVAESICQGMGLGSIATSLHIRPGTVKTHTRNIYRKLRVKNKVNMMLVFIARARTLSTKEPERMIE